MRTHGAKRSMNCDLASKYGVKKRLGSGGFADVYLAERQGRKAALKIIPKESVVDGSAEVEALLRLNHPCIIKLHRCIESGEQFILELEFFDGVELLEYIERKGRLSESESRKIFRQVASAISYMHSMGIVHRDLKLENILISREGKIKLIDFGFSSFYAQGKKKASYCGTPFYASPEMIIGVEYTGPEVDYWSMGVVLYSMLTGKLPFFSSSLLPLLTSIVLGKYPKPCGVSSEAAAAISSLLTVDMAKRGTIRSKPLKLWINQDQDKGQKRRQKAGPLAGRKKNASRQLV